MDDLNAKNRLKQLEEESAKLREKIKLDKKERLENEAIERKKRDERLDIIREKIDEMLKELYVYNKKGKIERDKVDIFGKIKEIMEDKQ